MLGYGLSSTEYIFFLEQRANIRPRINPDEMTGSIQHTARVQIYIFTFFCQHVRFVFLLTFFLGVFLIFFFLSPQPCRAAEGPVGEGSGRDDGRGHERGSRFDSGAGVYFF